MHAYLNDKCAIIDCLSPVESGFRTCKLPDHRALERAYYKKGKALANLRQRLKNVAVLADSAGVPESAQDDLDAGDEEVVVESAASCNGKPEIGNRKLKAFFGRRRTHNEQIIMRPCGVIPSRATFYGSEAVSAVNVRPLGFSVSLVHLY